MMLGVVLGMLLRVVGLGKILTMHKKHQKRKTTMEPIRMQKMELTMEMVSTNKTNSREKKLWSFMYLHSRNIDYSKIVLVCRAVASNRKTEALASIIVFRFCCF